MNDQTEVIEPNRQLETRSQTAPAIALLNVFDRVISDPTIDLARVKELMAMQREAMAIQANVEYSTAMSLAQGDMTTAIRVNRPNTQTKSRYADYHAVDKVIRPVYAAHGLSLSFKTGESKLPDHIKIICHVKHTGGHVEIHDIDMPADGKGAKGGDVMTKTHATKSAVTYGMRTLAIMIFNLSIEGDDDGNQAGGRQTIELISEEECQALNMALTETKSNIDAFLKLFRIECLPDLPKARFAEAMAKIEKKKAQGAKK